MLLLVILTLIYERRFAAKARTIRTFVFVQWLQADSGSVVIAMVSPRALKTSIE